MKRRKWNKKTNRPVVMIDFDDVCAFTLNALLDVYNQMYNTSFTVEDIIEWDLTKQLGKKCLNIFTIPGFYRKLKEKYGAFSVIKDLIACGKYDVYIVTACLSPEEFTEKVALIREAIPEFKLDRLVSLKDKHRFRADVIVDDKLATLIKCNPYMECVVMDMPHNRISDEFTRIQSLNELPALLEELFY